MCLVCSICILHVLERVSIDELINTHLCINVYLYAYMICTSHVPCVQYIHYTCSGLSVYIYIQRYLYVYTYIYIYIYIYI